MDALLGDFEEARSDKAKLRSTNEELFTKIKQLQMSDSSMREQVTRLQAENNDLKSLIDMSKVTSDAQNADILNRIEINDPSFCALWLRGGTDRYDVGFCPKGSSDMEMLGFYISKNSELHILYLTMYDDEEYFFNRADVMEPFFKVLRDNRSIQTLQVFNSDLSDRGSMFNYMAKFFQSSNSLTTLELEDCQMSAEASRALSLALKGCSCSLREFRLNGDLDRVGIDDEQSAEIIEALGVHHLLELIEFKYNQIEVKGCDQALATLLVNASNLHTLDLSYNSIDDEGLEALVHALAGGSKVRVLKLFGNSITAKGQGALSKLLCDTSTVNQTFLSNHTLRNVHTYRNDYTHPYGDHQSPSDLIQNLHLNNLDDKSQVATVKILQHHVDFDMRPMFKWDFKVLPLVLKWLETANDCPTYFEKNISRRKLSVIYQFVMVMPAMFVGRLGVNKGAIEKQG